MTLLSPSISLSAAAEIKSLASSFGFDLCALTPLAPRPEEEARLKTWVNKGRAAGMAYMEREPEKRANPRSLFPSAQTALVLGVSYFQGAFPPSPGPGFGKAARYAWGLDYHEVIGERLVRFGHALKKMASPIRPEGWAVDAKPVLERALAVEGGLGFIGKNTMMIAPRKGKTGTFHVGSFLFLAEIMLENEVQPDAIDDASPGGCGTCSSCMDACPTGAFKGSMDLDAGLCLAYLTIENKGPIPIELREKVGDWVFGCDICQDVCPFNARAAETKWPEFRPDKGGGAWLNLKEILEFDDNRLFNERFRTSPLLRARRKGLTRNALVVAGNQRAEALGDLVEKKLTDPEPLVQAHALWAWEKIAGQASAQKAAKKIEVGAKDDVLLKEINRILKPK